VKGIPTGHKRGLVVCLFGNQHQVKSAGT
jgi:hypothetical protein